MERSASLNYSLIKVEYSMTDCWILTFRKISTDELCISLFDIDTCRQVLPFTGDLTPN